MVLMVILHSLAAVFTQRPQSSGFQRELNVFANISSTKCERAETQHWFQVKLYLFVDSAELSVLVEQLQFLLVSGGDDHALSDQSDLLLSGQQPASHWTHIPRPAHIYR